MHKPTPTPTPWILYIFNCNNRQPQLNKCYAMFKAIKTWYIELVSSVHFQNNLKWNQNNNKIQSQLTVTDFEFIPKLNDNC